jgi:large subunit ribosomal protein L24
MAPIHLRKGDTVKVLVGRDAGKTGKVLKVFIEKDKASVEKLNMVKKHSKATQKNPEGGIVEKEAAIHLSNLMLVCGRCKKSTRLKTKMVEGKKRVRVCRHCGEII